MQFLLFDENPVLLKFIGGELLRLGYTVQRTRSPERALELLEEHAIDVAILDADAAENASLGLLESIRKNPETVGMPILFLSMSAEEDVARRFQQFEHVSCLTKPIRTARLCEVVEALIWQDRTAVGDSEPMESDPQERVEVLPAPRSGRRRSAPVRPRRPNRGYIDDPRRAAAATAASPVAVKIAPDTLSLMDFTQRSSRLFYPGSIDLFELMTDPRRSIADYSAVVSKHPALQDAVIKRVNSAKFGLRRRVISISEACALMGLRDLCATCLYNSEVDEHAFVTRVWRQSVVTGYVARRLADHLCPELTREAALGGMLQTLGVVALLLVPHPDYERVITRVRESGRSLAEVELEILGFQHAELGALLVPKIGGRDSVAGIVNDGADPKDVVNAASWCAFVASSATQLRIKTLRRHADPTADLQLLARHFPSYWKQGGALLTTFFNEVDDYQEVFNS